MKKVNILLAIPIVLAITVVLSGCATSSSEQMNLTPEGDKTKPVSSATEDDPAKPGPEPSDTPITENQDRLDLRLTQTPPAGLERVEIPEFAPVTGEVPAEILEDIFTDLIERSGADSGDIKVLRAEAVVWNDGALGCPKPGEVYIQMMINGYWVVLEVEGVEYDYRVSDNGYFTFCEASSGLPPISSPGSGADLDQ